MNLAHKLLNRTLRKNRVRSKVSGTQARPRLSVSISNVHVSAQIIDDISGKTLVAATTVGAKKTGTKTELAAWVGEQIASKAVKQKITQVVLDRNGRAYAGRLSALADAARKSGLEF
jgi:large subunit ribosomal protein L18